MGEIRSCPYGEEGVLGAFEKGRTGSNIPEPCLWPQEACAKEPGRASLCGFDETAKRELLQTQQTPKYSDNGILSP